MRIKTELSERPPRFTVNREGQKAVIIFYTDVVEKQREGMEEGEVTVSYEAVSWTMETPWTDNIEQRINEDFADWLQNAQADAYTEAAAEVRAKRNALIAETDYMMCIDRLGLVVPSGTTFTNYRPDVDKVIEAATGAVSAYRQALRDVPEQPGFPFDIDWPEKP